jgi:O-antigen/teichoic acid export membrane protein
MTVASDGQSPAGSMRRDLATAYLASATRFGSSVIVSALVFRFVGRAEFAMLALVRGTIGLLNYTSLGLAPALIHRAADATRAPLAAMNALPARQDTDKTLSYFVPGPALESPLARLHSTAIAIAYAAALIGGVATVLYAAWFDTLYRVPAKLREVMPIVVIWIGGGMLMRLAGDASGAVLQIRGRIALDNLLLAVGDLLWVALAGASLLLAAAHPPDKLNLIASAFILSSLVVLYTRIKSAERETGIHSPHWRQIDIAAAKSLLGYGLLVVVAQLADYLYAPTDYILIDRLLSPAAVAFYAPAVQIDSGLLLLVTGLSAVMLPKAALAHAGGSTRTVRAYYIRGTLASLALLAVASLCVWAAGPWILRLWLGNPMPETQAILPLVLIGTTLGGASAVGRSILLAVGKAKPFAISVLIAGVVNAGCSYVFVRYFRWGLPGILWGTVVAVVLRCVFWMPWYVLRILRADRGGAVGGS